MMTSNSIRSRPLLAVGLMLVLLVVFAWLRLWPHLNSPSLERKDFAQLYAMGHATRVGSPIYEPLPRLGHASAYPPAMAILMAPLSNLSYRNAFTFWIGIETLCFLIAVALIAVHFRQHGHSIITLIVASLFTVWWPFFVDLYQGQVMMLILLLLTATWVNLRHGRDLAGGLFLGLVLALKLYGWPILLMLLLLKRFRAAASAVVIFSALNLIAVLWIGVGQAVHYVSVVGPSISRIYRGHPLNFSAFSIGAEHGVAIGALLALSILCAALIMARRSGDFDHAFMIMLIASSVLSPVSWVHYFVTFLPAICLLALRVSWKEVLIIITLGFFCVADAAYLTPYFSVDTLRPVPLLAVLSLLGVSSLRGRQTKAAVEIGNHVRTIRA